MIISVFIFFCKQKTAYEMRISDWSSDVCSSDLLLKLNASTVRERHKMRLKIKAASSEGRASAMILTAAPFIAIGFIMISSPHFYGDVIHERFVQVGLGIIGFWMFLGNLVMRNMINMKL